jgi:predicted acetyltransferase
MSGPGDVRLEPAGAADAPLLANLLELYLHDLSEIFELEVGADGRFGYDLSRYRAEPARRFAFLVRRGARTAGFALVTRGSPASDDPDVFDLTEFFVLRAHRRSHVGRRAAFLLWDALPGRWVVRVSEANRAGIPFWEATVHAYTQGAYATKQHPGRLHPFRVFSFESAPGPEAPAR